MSVPFEDLSRLRSGDLPPDEAAALRSRIAREPALAAAWARLLALEDELAALPRGPAPAALDAAVLAAAPPPRWRAPAGLVPLAALAAGLLLGAMGAWSAAPGAPVVAVTGATPIVGRVALQVAGLPVAIDGRAVISVEPADPVARGTEAEAEMKTIGAGLAGLVAGAVVTVAVTEGRATVGEGPAATTIPAGSTGRFAAPGGGASPAPGVDAASPEGAVAALRAEVEALRAENERLRFSEGLARGQLAGLQGEEVPWPDDVAAAFRPAAFDAALREAVGQLPGLSVAQVDCSEYPCVAVLVTDGPLDGFRDRIEALPQALSPDPESSDALLLVNQSDDGSGSRGAVLLSVAPEGTLGDGPVGQRTKFRGETLLREVVAP